MSGEREATMLTTGAPVPEDRSHETITASGMQRGYVVLTEEERAKGFVRPVRDMYKHVGIPGPAHPLRDLTDEERDRHLRFAPYVKFEEYPKDPNSAAIGRFWTQAQLDSVGKGCGSTTTMAMSIAETYARNPHFYGGTFCSRCAKHFPVGAHGEFVWLEMDGTVTDLRVGT